MRRSLLFLFTGLILFFVAVTSVQAQIGREGIPASVQLQLPNPTTSVDVTPAINWAVINSEDDEAKAMNLPLRAGFSLPIDKSIDSDGEWELLPDGRMLWRLKIETGSAVSTGVVFDMFHLPEGAELYIYNESKSFILGAFTSDNNNPANVFSTHLIPGSTVIIEYIESPANGFMNGSLNPTVISGRSIARKPVENGTTYTPQGVLHISEVIYAYNDEINDQTRDLGDAASCQVNINCSPEGDNWQDEKRGVARILFREGASWYYCSGTLVNNTLENGTPYFLTAYH